MTGVIDLKPNNQHEQRTLEKKKIIYYKSLLEKYIG